MLHKKCPHCGGKIVRSGLKRKCASCGSQVGKTIRTPLQVTHSGLRKGWKSKTARRAMK